MAQIKGLQYPNLEEVHKGHTPGILREATASKSELDVGTSMVTAGSCELSRIQPSVKAVTVTMLKKSSRTN
jgi:hypothetical protein